MTELTRIADALEHLVYPQIIHPSGCVTCQAKRKPIKKMPDSTVLDSAEMAKREALIRHRRMLAGPEQPVGDTFRYRELNKPST